MARYNTRIPEGAEVLDLDGNPAPTPAQEPPPSGLKYYKIIIQKASESTSAWVPLTPGELPTYTVPIGFELILPEPYVECLRSAVAEQTKFIMRPGRKPKTTTETFYRYPFQILGEVTEKEWLKWRDEQRAKKDPDEDE